MNVYSLSPLVCDLWYSVVATCKQDNHVFARCWKLAHKWCQPPDENTVDAKVEDPLEFSALMLVLYTLVL